jgi:hypothetical protein
MKTYLEVAAMASAHSVDGDVRKESNESDERVEGAPDRVRVAEVEQAALTDQAHGLRRLFAGQAPFSLPVVANPHVVWSGAALEALARHCLALDRRVLLIDAADTAPPASEAAALGLSAAVESLSPGLFYLAAGGLPRRFVDTRGSAARLIDEAVAACPQADAVLVHAECGDLIRLFRGRQARPLLMLDDSLESLKHSYAAWKLLAQRSRWLSADAVVLGGLSEARRDTILSSLAHTADDFFGGSLIHHAGLDPLMGEAAFSQSLLDLLQAQPAEAEHLLSFAHPLAPVSDLSLTPRT